MRIRIVATILAFLCLSIIISCNYLDVVPDDVATLNNAFDQRDQAKKFLFTCYSFMPKNGVIGQDPATDGGDEMWRIISRADAMFNIARGLQNVVSPYGNFYWDDLYQGIRDCNILLANIERVPDMEEWEKRQWAAEAEFLKAYYHFYLLRMYGPIPLIKKNLPINADTKQVGVSRAPVDSCFKYIVQLINEATPNLPLIITDPADEAGRITQPIALSFKAKVLVYAASPLFNGNTDEATLKGPEGQPLFNQISSKAKWDSAAVACEQAINICQQEGMKLYDYQQDFQQYNLTDTIKTQMSIRNSVCEKWNSEIIWANTQSFVNSLQPLIMPWVDFSKLDNYIPRGELSPPLKIAEMFYTNHGVPIDEDKTWDYNNRYTLRVAGPSDALYIRQGYTTAYLNFDRGPRFYADLGFDGGIWYGQGKYDDSQPMTLFYLEAKRGQPDGPKADRSSVTGYFIKKLVHYQNVIGTGTAYSTNVYPWPIMRLSDLYLLYAEALNESQGPGPEVYKYINLVRQRAGLSTVQSAWSNYSIDPTKYTTQKGMRDIIHRERLIELAFEGQRFWDLRRWKEAAIKLNGPVQGWDGSQSDAVAYYVPTTLFNQTFGSKDYFWPIEDANITLDKNLVQNLGW